MAGELIFAVDGGGTGSRARLLDPGGAVLAEAEGGPANLLVGDGSAPFAAIVDLARATLAAAGLAGDAVARLHAGLGLAGATGQGRARFFARRPPFAETRILSDAHAALLGAHGGGDGGIVIQGTGSAACVLKDGRLREIGGWGFEIDDGGSGADIGRRALRRTLRGLDEAEDTREPGGALADALLARFGGDPYAIMDWAREALPRDFAAFAPLVFDAAEAGDPEARHVLSAAARETARLVALCRTHGAGRVALLGSVARRLEPWLPALTRDCLVEPQGDARDGAALAVARGLGVCE